MIKKLLVAYDGSESAEKAFSLALDLASRYGAELFALAVARPPEFANEVEAEAIIEISARHCSSLLRPLEAKADAAGIVAHFETSVGHPAEQIIYHAERHGADMIVMGHRGQGLFERLLIGSVARQVLAHARCAVLIAR